MENNKSFQEQNKLTKKMIRECDIYIAICGIGFLSASAFLVYHISKAFKLI